MKGGTPPLSRGWVFPTVVICTYGFFSMMRPAEPFLTPFLIGPFKNLTVEEVSKQVYPIWTYSKLFLLVPVFLLTDLLRYKPIVILQGVSYVAAWLILLYSSGVEAAQYALLTYSLASVSDVGYYSYIYSVVQTEHYQRVTGYCRACVLMGFAVGSLLGQLLVSFAGVSYYWLNVLTLAFLCIGLFSSFLLPMPQRSLLFNKRQSEGLSNAHRPSKSSWVCLREVTVEKIASTAVKLFKDCRDCYSSATLLFISLWFSMGKCGFFQVANYVQILWASKEPSGNVTEYNGAVDAVATLSGAAVSLAAGHVKLNWCRWAELILGVFSAANAGAVYLMDFTSSIWICYAAFVVFKSTYMLLITICTFQIAKNLSRKHYALIFGMNTFVATVLQTLLTAIVIDTKNLHLTLNTQYLIYATYFAAVALIFLARGVYNGFFMSHTLLTEPISHGMPSERDANLSVEMKSPHI